MAEGESIPRGPLTLKSQIYEARRGLYDTAILEMNDKGLCGVYEALFGFLRQWIESEGNEDEKREMEQVVHEYETTKRDKVYYDVSIRHYDKLFFLTINRDQNTRREATVETFNMVRQDMIDETWGDLKIKRMNQYQKLWDIFNEMTDADEDVGNKSLTASKLRGNYDVNND